MGIIFDIVIIAIIIACAFAAAKQGFVKTVIELVGFFLAIYLSFVLSGVAADIGYNKIVKPTVTKSITEKFTADDALNENKIDSVWETLPGYVKSLSDKFGVNKNLLISGEEQTQSIETVASDICDTAVKPIAFSFIKSVSMIILSIILLFVIKILAKLINKLFSFNLVGSLNKLLGAFVGIFKGAVYCLIIILTLTETVRFTNGFWIFNKENLEASFIISNVIKSMSITL